MKNRTAQVAPRAARRTRGMTLPELMVSVAVGSVVLTMIATVFVSSARSFAAMSNRFTMGQESRGALDRMTREIRRAGDLVSFSTNQLVFATSGANKLIYRWDSSSHQLVQWQTGETKTNVLLNGCDALQFSMFRNSRLPGGGYTNATTVAQAKCIGVAWKCSRTVLGSPRNTEDMQQAIIIIRNKRVS